MKLTLNTFLTLDGVMQGPGGADEDRSGGFNQGGWVGPLVDEDFGRIVSGWFAEADAILFGRTTYDLMADYWPEVTDSDNPAATALNTLPKYVVSTTLRDPSWHGSTVISDNVIEAISELKAKPGRELQVHGSCGLAHTLHDAGLVDEYRLIIFPVVVGQGKRLFHDGAVPTALSLVNSETTSVGGIHLTLRPAGALGTGDFIVEDGKEGYRES